MSEKKEDTKKASKAKSKPKESKKPKQKILDVSEKVEALVLELKGIVKEHRGEIPVTSCAMINHCERILDTVSKKLKR